MSTIEGRREAEGALAPGKSLSIAIVVLAAVVPLVGVLAGNWSLREVVVLYWAENVIIGVLQVVRMLTVSPPGAPVGMHVAKVGLAGFFTVHYGMFCLVHGVFVFALTGKEGLAGGSPLPASVLEEFPSSFWVALGVLGANHVWTLVDHYYRKGGYRATTPAQLMGEPYKHIVVLHLGILLGAFLSIALGHSLGVLVIIVIGKLLIDLREIRRDERRV